MAESSTGAESFLRPLPPETSSCHSHSESCFNAELIRLDRSGLGWVQRLLARAITSHAETSVTRSPDSTRIASSSLDETVQMWQAR